MNLNAAFKRLFNTDLNLIEPDPRAEAIQRDLDAEHDRQARSQRQVWSPPGTHAPRRLSEVFGDE